MLRFRFALPTALLALLAAAPASASAADLTISFAGTTNVTSTSDGSTLTFRVVDPGADANLRASDLLNALEVVNVVVDSGAHDIRALTGLTPAGAAYGDLRLASDGAVTLSGNVGGAKALTVEAASGLTFGGALSAEGDVTLDADVTYTGDWGSVTSQTGDVTVEGTFDGAGAFTAEAGGSITFAQAIGGTTPVGYLGLDAPAIALPDAVTTSDMQSYDGDTTLPAGARLEAAAFETRGAALRIPTGSARLEATGEEGYDESTLDAPLRGAGALTVAGATVWSFGASVGSDPVPVTVDGTSVRATSDHANEIPLVLRHGGIVFGYRAFGAVSVGAGGGLVDPGPRPASGHGSLALGSLALGAGSTVRIDAAPSSGFDRLTVAGTVALGGAALDVAVAPDGSPNHVSTILEKQSAGLVDGTFAGLPEGSVIARGGASYRLSYVGGDGNDVTLTQLIEGTVGLASSASGAQAGEGVTLTARFTPPAFPPGFPVPAVDGTVTFRDGATVLGTAPLVDGKAELTTATLAIGTRQITAEFGGNAAYAAATSASLAVTVTAAPTPSPGEGGDGGAGEPAATPEPGGVPRQPAAAPGLAQTPATPQPATAQPAAPPVPFAMQVKAALSTVTQTVAGQGRVSFTQRFPSAGRVRWQLDLSVWKPKGARAASVARPVQLATSARAVAAGQATATLRLSKRSRALLRRHERARLVLRTTFTAADGSVHQARRTLDVSPRAAAG